MSKVSSLEPDTPLALALPPTPAQHSKCETKATHSKPRKVLDFKVEALSQLVKDSVSTGSDEQFNMIQHDIVISEEVQLADSKRIQLDEEFKALAALMSFGLDGSVDYTNLDDVISVASFDNIVQESKKMPMIQEMMSFFFDSGSARQSQETIDQRKLRVLHAYGCLLHVKSQRTSSELPLIVAILLASFGCGEGN